jgi:hypothetical protein
MLKLKRLYDQEAPRESWGKIESPCPTCTGRGVVINAANTGVDKCSACAGTGTAVRPVPPVIGVQVLNAGKTQHFSTRLVEGGLAEGWLSMAQGIISLGSGPTVTRYKIESGPGLYCCFCQAKQDDSVSAQGHVARAHAGGTSPDESNPSGYRRDNFYTGTLLEG